MKLHFYIFIVLILTGCSQEEKCKFNPEPIFKPEWSKVSNYSFVKNGSKATEKVTFPNGVNLELFQTICNNTQQEYHFHLLPGDYTNKPDDFWVAEAANQFFNMAGVGKEVEGIAGWGLTIQNEPSRFILGEKIGIENGIFIKIDKLVGISDAQVVITISQIVE